MYGINAAVGGSTSVESLLLKPIIKPSRRRDKPQMSCMTCRQRKLKCDRLRPCGNCTKRGHPDSCCYVKQASMSGHAAASRKASNIQDRVRNLEEMVVTLMNSQPEQRVGKPTSEKIQDLNSPVQAIGSNQPAVSSDVCYMDSSTPESSLGKFTRTSNQVNFVGSEHWEAILEEIAELKNDFETPNTEPFEIAEFKPQILFGVNKHATRAEIMSSIPPKPFCDMLMSRWFSIMDMAPLVIHVPHFMKEYNQMWECPDNTPLMWIGLLFAILGLASNFSLIPGAEPDNLPEPFRSSSEMASHYRDRSAQCLVEVNYLKPVRYTIETLCFYYILEGIGARDPQFGASVLLGIIARVAMRLGYHRDASHFPKISPFDGEMRRRVWSMIVQIDLITSAQIGLPRVIRDGEWDTDEPRNLLDTDFDESLLELPRSRPDTDPTPVGYAIFKVRLLRQLGLILDYKNSMKSPSYHDVMNLDSQLCATHASLPPYLMIQHETPLAAGDAHLMLHRYALELCFQKSRCVLHRKYLIPGQTNPQYRFSRTVSVDAAMKLLNIQHFFHGASQMGGRLYSERWRMSALINQDYLLAAMILCLDLSWGERASRILNLNEKYEVEMIWPRDLRVQKLQTSYEIWNESCKVSQMAAKAAEALKIMLGDLKPTSSSLDPSMADYSVVAAYSSPEQTLIPSRGDEPNTQGVFTANSLELDSETNIKSASTDLVPGMNLGTEMNFDWELWDTHFQMDPMTPMQGGLEEFDVFAFRCPDALNKHENDSP